MRAAGKYPMMWQGLWPAFVNYFLSLKRAREHAKCYGSTISHDAQVLYNAGCILQRRVEWA